MENPVLYDLGRAGDGFNGQPNCAICSHLVPHKRNRFGHYVASGEINDQDVVFLLDTGATVVSVPIGIARRLELKPGAGRTVETANGRIITYATTLDSVKIGNIELNRVAASINPHSDSREVLL